MRTILEECTQHAQRRGDTKLLDGTKKEQLSLLFFPEWFSCVITIRNGAGGNNGHEINLAYM